MQHQRLVAGTADPPIKLNARDKGVTQMKTFAIFAMAAIATGAAHSALAQQATPTGAGSDSSSSLDEVIVTGTRRTDRTVVDSASPIDIISSAEIRSQPAGNMLDQLKAVVPSFFVGQNTISDASSLVRAPSLRGLPSD